MSLSKKGKTWIFVAVGLVIIILVGGVLIYNWAYQEHREIKTVTSDFVGSSRALAEKVASQPENWTNKVVEISGAITELEDSACVVSDQIFCQLLGKPNRLEENQEVKIKGRVIGYDDLFEQVKLDQCTILD